MNADDEPPVPPALRRERQWLLVAFLGAIAFVATFAAIAMALAILLQATAAAFCLIGPILLMTPIIIAGAVALRYQTARWRRRLEPGNFEACLHCGYLRGGLPDEHPCPECGKPYDKDLAPRAWRRHLYV